jgi:hypothetical protein
MAAVRPNAVAYNDALNNKLLDRDEGSFLKKAVRKPVGL